MPNNYPEWCFKVPEEEFMAKMGYSIIFTLDMPRTERIGRYMPERRIRRKLYQTEGDDQYEYGYLGGDYKHGKHRKLCGILTSEEFQTFVHDTGLAAQDIETMGSLGAPGFGFGWAPAISFTAEAVEPAFVDAYVTPLPFYADGDDGPEPPQNEAESDTAWQVVRELVIKRFGY